MDRNKPFLTQLVIVGGFLAFVYVLFVLATSVYHNYNLDRSISSFQAVIEQLAEKVHQKPKYVAYYQSSQYKDRYAKENLNLLNPGERLIIIPQEEKVVKTETLAVESIDNTTILTLPNRNQWWQYFFGNTLAVEIPQAKPAQDPSSNLEGAIEPKNG